MKKRFYSKMLPGRFDEPLGFGADSQVRIDNFISQLSGNLNTKLQAQGISIVGFSTVKINDKLYKVGDVIEVNGIKGRILADGSISVIE